jgi:cyclopropane-fatty-acyl-phospholipid synthase
MSVTVAADQASRLTLDVLQALLTGDTAKQVGVRLWDGTCWPDDSPRPATLVLKHPGALRAMFLPGTEVGLGEAYLYDDFDIEGNAEAVFAIADSFTSTALDWRKKLRAGSELTRLPASKRTLKTHRGPARLSGRRHSVERDRQAVTYHYDVSNDFYSLWLDNRMVYSCAYFHSAGDSLNTAQEQKLDTICRKLRLKPGQRLLDLGCGWGGLVIYAAQHYGVDATGITLSKPQATLANARIAAAGLSNRCRVLVQDYREVPVGEEQQYDRLVSVGMFEHVGAAKLPAYFAQAWKLLKPGGVFLNHGIACRATDATVHGPSFSEAYVFPDGELVPINITLHAAEEAGFEVRDVESLREHYALTLRHWVHNLETNHDEALKYVDEPTYRVWRLYMSGSAYGFSMGRNNVYQTLLAKPDGQGHSGLPWTRADWYE